MSLDRILTMSFLEGKIVGDFLKGKPEPNIRNTIGGRLVELYHFQIQCLQVLHADHQPGNYLFTPEGNIGLVDFGCVKRLAIDFEMKSRTSNAHNSRRRKTRSRRMLDGPARAMFPSCTQPLL